MYEVTIDQAAEL